MKKLLICGLILLASCTPRPSTGTSDGVEAAVLNVGGIGILTYTNNTPDTLKAVSVRLYGVKPGAVNTVYGDCTDAGDSIICPTETTLAPKENGALVWSGKASRVILGYLRGGTTFLREVKQ